MPADLPGQQFWRHLNADHRVIEPSQVHKPYLTTMHLKVTCLALRRIFQSNNCLFIDTGTRRDSQLCWCLNGGWGEEASEVTPLPRTISPPSIANLHLSCPTSKVILPRHYPSLSKEFLWHTGCQCVLSHIYQGASEVQLLPGEELDHMLKSD